MSGCAAPSTRPLTAHAASDCHRHRLACCLLVLLAAVPALGRDATTNHGDGRQAARLAANMSVAQAGSASRPVIYAIRLANRGSGEQPDDPASDELVDVLPPELALRMADADRGAITVDLAANSVRWNGALAAGATAMIRIEADVVVTQPATIRNQAAIAWDGDGDGRNDRTGLSTDPSQPGEAAPATFRFAGIKRPPGDAPAVPAGRRPAMRGPTPGLLPEAFVATEQYAADA